MTDEERLSILYRKDLINVRLESNGNYFDTRIVDVDTGKVLNNVSGMDFHLHPDNQHETLLTLSCMPFRYEGPALVVFVCSSCRERAKESEIEEFAPQHDLVATLEKSY